MSSPKPLKLDKIGYWSEIKLDIIRDYAKEYSRILSAQRQPSLHHVYVDAFAGAGVHESKSTGQEIDGSPRIAVDTLPPFREYHFVDLDGSRVENLRAMFAGNSSVRVYHGDSNDILLSNVFPQIQYRDFKRGLCLLDPYGLHLDWNVIATAGGMKTIDMFLNFPIADMNRNVFWRNPTGVAADDISRMNAFWGDDSWRRVAYQPVKHLFGEDEEKTDNATIAEAFRKRLVEVAGFKWVPKPIPMRNSNGAVVYYLFFASQKPVAAKIVEYIFDKFRDKGLIQGE